MKSYVRLTFDMELYFIAEYESGGLKLHPMHQIRCYWVVEKKIVAQDLTREEAEALIKVVKGGEYER